ncbi:unnamed protein product [Alopecurus aequalis]
MRNPTLGEFIFAALELGGSAGRLRRRRARFAPGGRGSRFKGDGGQGLPREVGLRGLLGSSPRAIRPEQASRGGRKCTPTETPRTDGEGARSPPIQIQPGAARPSGQTEFSGRGTQAVWVVPGPGPLLRPNLPALEGGPALVRGDLLASGPAQVDGLVDSEAQSRGVIRVGRATRPTGPNAGAETYKWWWIPRGASTLDLGFPASEEDIRRRGRSARKIHIVSPPAPLTLSFSQAVMASRGPVGGANSNGKRPAVADARAEAERRARQHRDPDGPRVWNGPHPPPFRWVDREKRRAARRAAAGEEGQQGAGAAQEHGRAPVRIPVGPQAGPLVSVAPAQQRRPPAPKPSAAKTPQAAGGTAGPSKVECFKCGRVGHFQAGCTFDPICVLCSKEGQNSAECPNRGAGAALRLYGQAISGEGFFYLDFEEDEGDEVGASLAAVISFSGMALSAADLKVELSHLVECQWDWQLTQLSRLEYQVEFPSRDMLELCTRSGRLFLPLSNSSASIRLAEVDTAPAAILQEAWILLSGLPKKLRRAPIPAARSPPPAPPGPGDDPANNDFDDDDLLDDRSPTQEEWEAMSQRGKAPADGAGSDVAPKSASRSKEHSQPTDPTPCPVRRCSLWTVPRGEGLGSWVLPDAPTQEASPGATTPAGSSLVSVITGPDSMGEASPVTVAPVSPATESGGEVTTRVVDATPADAVVLENPAPGEMDVDDPQEETAEITNDNERDHGGLRDITSSASMVPRSRRTRTVAADPPHKSARLTGPMEMIPVPLRAELRAADKNQGGTTPSQFEALSSLSDVHISTVLSDSGLVFNSECGQPSEIISLVRAKEVAQAALAKAAADRAKVATIIAQTPTVAE